MRTFSTSLMVLLVVAALFFGNCFSCPRMLLAWQSQQPLHNCCPSSQPVSASCQSQDMQHFVKADNGAQPPMVPVAAELIVHGSSPGRARPTRHRLPSHLNLSSDRVRVGQALPPAKPHLTGMLRLF